MNYCVVWKSFDDPIYRAPCVTDDWHRQQWAHRQHDHSVIPAEYYSRSNLPIDTPQNARTHVDLCKQDHVSLDVLG